MKNTLQVIVAASAVTLAQCNKVEKEKAETGEAKQAATS